MKHFAFVLAKLLAANFVCTIALAATLDPEIVPASLICAVIASPSLLLYAILDALRRRKSMRPEVIYWASLVPFAAYLAWCACVGPEGQEIAAVMLGLYVLPSLFALSVNLLTTPQ